MLAMTKKIKNLVIFICLATAMLALAHFALAAGPDTGLDQVVGTGLGVQDPRVIAANIIRIVLGFLGIIAVGLIIYAGWLWMTAAGEPEKIEKAKKILIGAVIGLVICLASFAIASFILSRLIGATGGGDGTVCDPPCSGDTPYCCNSVCSSSSCGNIDIYSGQSFKIASTWPDDGDTGMVRNVVVKVFFNKAIGDQVDQAILDSNFKVEKIADIDAATGAETALAAPQLIVGEREITDGRMVINFKDSDNCGDAQGTVNCLPSYSKFKIAVNGFSGIVSVNNQSLSCSASAPCEFVFSTGDKVDTVAPTAGIVPEQMCVDDGHLKDDANTVYGWGRDNIGISALSFKQRLASEAVDEQAGVPIAGAGTYQNVSFRYDTSVMTVGQKYYFSLYVSDVANHQASSSFSTILRPGHCCNGVKDSNETDTDCGGDCGACDGAACATDMSEPRSCSHSLCASQFCTTQNSSQAACEAAGYANQNTCCLCRRQPIIMGVFPTGGFCTNDINKACLADSDCAGAQCDLEKPNGTAGNFVTISGKYFGASRGKVYFSSSTAIPWVEAELADDATLGNAACADSVWSDTQVIAIVPTGAVVGPIKVATASNFSDDTTANPSLSDFVINTIARPSLCKLEPSHGKMNDTINYYGIKLSDSQAYYGNWLGKISALNSNISSNKQGSAQVPNLATGRTSSFVVKLADKVYSNYVNFYKDPEPYTGPTIVSFEPVQGKAGQYVTIRGSGFGRAKGTSKVFFGDTEVSYDFPEVCQDSVWSDKQVIVKVPKRLDDGDYHINMQVGTYTVDTSKITPDKFKVDSALELTPSLCKISPAKGQINSEVNLYGEYFGNKDSALIRFQANKDQSGDNINFWGKEKTADKATTIVPNGAITGEVRIIQAANLVSNPLNFSIGKCVSHSECGSEAVCCPDNSPFKGKCLAYEKDQAGNIKESSVQGLCFSKIKASVYEWDFTTGDILCKPSDMCGGVCCAGGTCLSNACVCPATASTKCRDGCCATACDSNGKCPDQPAESCAGYGGTAQSCASQMCPNSPGKCSVSSGAIKITGSCGYSYCNSANSVCAGSCEYDSNLNKCKLSEIKCESTAGQVYTLFDAEGADALNRIPVDGIATEGANKVYYEKGYKESLSNEFIPVDTAKRYYIYGRFKSAGAGKVCMKGGSPVWLGPPINKYKHCTSDPTICTAPETCEPFMSRLYFGLAPYDEDREFISDMHVLRVGSEATINNITDTQIAVNEVIAGWYQAGSMAYQRSLGFYYDGDTSHLPDSLHTYYATCSYLISSNTYCIDSSSGAYDGTNINGGTIISLNNPVPASVIANIIPGTTVVKNHTGGGTYMYSAAANTPVPFYWEDFAYNKGGITGEGFGNDPNIFRPGTKYIKLLFLLNYWQSADEEIRFDDIVIASEECRKVNGIYVYQINTGGTSCPAGTYLDTNEWCTIIKAGGTAGQPATCNLITCPSGFTCQAGKCVINKEVCASGSSCNVDQCQTSGAAACECCCRIGYAAQDCCYPLDCTGKCGSDLTANTNTYGRCSGCAKAGVNQEDHNKACNCTGTSGKVCLINTANPTGICQDCAQISDAAVCNGQGVGTCCVDAKNKNACRAGVAPYATGSPDYNYCAYYECNSGSCSDTPVATSNLPSYKTLTECNNKCVGFACLNEDGTGPAAPKCGICCCDPDVKPDTCKSLNSLLVCEADQGSCSGASRGLCCGCSKDSDCGSPDTVGCGADACCQARPIVEEVKPTGANVCRNSMIQATFDMPMRVSSFRGNVIVAADYGADQCPAGTNYLTAAYRASWLEKIKYWLAKLPLLNKLFTAEARAENLSGNFCAVPGTVSGSANSTKTTLEFKPQKLLEAGRKYYVIIKGETDLTDAGHDGVLSQNGIGMKPADEKTFNGVTYKGKIWSFTTMAEQAANNGVCKIAYIQITPASKLFQTNKNDENDDASGDKFNTIEDSDLVYTAEARAADGSALNALAGIYEWSWNWSSGSTNVFDFILLGDSLPNNQKLLRAKDTATEGESIITATANVSGSQAATGEVYSAQAKAYLMVCANPWPPVKANGEWWPWQDNQNNIKNCIAQTGDCLNTNFELSYCRDAGGVGTADDLPAILSDTAVIRGQNLICRSKNLKCNDGTGDCASKAKGDTCGDGSGKCDDYVIGSCPTDAEKNDDCSDNTGTNTGTCQVDILKEFYFFRGD